MYESRNRTEAADLQKPRDYQNIHILILECDTDIMIKRTNSSRVALILYACVEH